MELLHPLRQLVVVALLCLSSSAKAQRPTLASLLAHTSCMDTVCMGRYADSLHFCRSKTGDGMSWLWFSCEHLRDGAMNVLEGTGLMLFSQGRGSRGYAIQTCDADYAKTLTQEMEDLGFKEEKAVANGAVHRCRDRAGVDLMRTVRTIPLNGSTATSWAFMALVTQ